jgi:hypothetical protein
MDYTDTFPPRCKPGVSNFKPSKMVARVATHLKRRGIDRKEDANKTKARKRDGHTCRFPLCVCRKVNYGLHISHFAQHKGSGGDPSGERSALKFLIAVCAPRHRESRMSIDKRTIKVTPLTAAGANGPVRIFVDVNALDKGIASKKPKWVAVGTETSIGIWEEFTPQQISILARVAALTE